MQSFLLVFLGAGIGGALRHAVNLAAMRLGTDFPVATLAVNSLGGFCMGMMAGWLAVRGEGHEPLRLFLATGVLGGFTTFSAFSLDAVLLWQRGELLALSAYIGASLILPILGLLLGLFVVRNFA